MAAPVVFASVRAMFGCKRISTDLAPNTTAKVETTVNSLKTRGALSRALEMNLAGGSDGLPDASEAIAPKVIEGDGARELALQASSVLAGCRACRQNLARAIRTTASRL